MKKKKFIPAVTTLKVRKIGIHGIPLPKVVLGIQTFSELRLAFINKLRAVARRHSTVPAADGHTL
jgi:hypothetical protein